MSKFLSRKDLWLAKRDEDRMFAQAKKLKRKARSYHHKVFGIPGNGNIECLEIPIYNRPLKRKEYPLNPTKKKSAITKAKKGNWIDHLSKI